jgi:hypothetical protein
MSRNFLRFFSVLTVLIAGILYANEADREADSIVKKSRPSAAITQATEYFNKGMQEMQAGNYKESEFLLRVSLQIRQELGLGLSEDTAKNHLALVEIFSQSSQSCLAKYHFQKATKIYEFLDRRIRPVKTLEMSWKGCPVENVQLSSNMNEGLGR